MGGSGGDGRRGRGVGFGGGAVEGGDGKSRRRGADQRLPMHRVIAH